MGAPQAWRVDAPPSGATSSASFTSNRAYVAHVESGSIYIAQLNSSGTFERRCRALPPHAFGLAPILALSPLRTSLLAISAGSRTSIWDIESDTLKHTIHANERSVTSSAWSHHNPNLIALGHIDGHVSLWNLDQLTRPKDVWSVGVSQCYLLSWNTAAPWRLAACCGQTISICDSDRSRETRIRRYDLDYRAHCIFWRPNSCSRFMTISPNGIIEEWSTTKLNESPESPDYEDQDLFGDFEDLRPCRRTPIDLGSIPTGSSIYVLGDNAVLVLASHGRSMRLYKDLLSTENDESIWDKQLMGRCEYIAILPLEESINIFAVGFRGMEKITVPTMIRAKLGSISNHDAAYKDHFPPQADIATGNAEKRTTMQPILVSAAPKPPHRSHAKSRTSHSIMRPMSYKRPSTGPSNHKNAKTNAPISPRQAMASSLELPKLYDEESPMPFLSPTIPSQRLSPIPTLSDDITLPPPENESFGSLPSTAIDESDSDDETFDGDDLKGSGTLMMPGGANVPLPKSCGAFFSPNGQLITYFPPKAKVKSNDIDGLSSSQPEERSTKASRLFPLFGNLAVEAHDYEDSDTESLSTQTDATSLGSPKAEMFSFSTPGEPTWTERFENLQVLPQHTSGQQTVIVSIRDVSEIIHFRPELARSYQLSCDSEETAGLASMQNAEVARSAGLDDLANVWSLLALIFHDKLPEDLITGADLDIPKMAKRVSRLLRTASGAKPTYTRQPSTFTGGPYLSRSKVGAAWLVSQIYAWTELRADVQMLACVSAVLLSSAQSIKSHSLSDTRLAPPTIDYFVDGARHDSHSSARPAPTLNADARDGSSLNHNATKQPRSSQVSSRDPSQPTTPYVDSLSSTPPFPFPKLSRQGSRLSASGSASPEHHRSSFGAAAKFYAQSITDKISSYGTSPPARRFGTSPNNELSSSLPGAVSWSKSVSFASGVDYGSRSSIRIAPEDDGYDSDRTIEDTSLPQTPKRYGGPVSFNLKNIGAFLPLKEANPYAQSQPTPLLSPSLAAKAKIWIGHYSEQLRRMDLQVQAAELDNIARQQRNTSSSSQLKKHTGITATATTPTTSKPRKAICSLCYCKIQGVQQVCSQCLHTTHISCLQEFADAGDSEDDMECPSGCGCVCSLTAYHETVWEAEEDVSSAPVAPPVARRKWSFTDPRRWREQVQGDSW